MKFNEKLLAMRKKQGLSQEELGLELQVSRQTISKWEAGQSYPDFQRLVLLSDYFGMSLDELVKYIEEMLQNRVLRRGCSAAVHGSHLCDPSAVSGNKLALVIISPPYTHDEPPAEFFPEAPPSSSECWTY